MHMRREDSTVSHYGAAEETDSRAYIFMNEENSDSSCCKAKSCWRCCCSWNIYWKVVVCFLIVIVYLLLGATVFMAVESPHERREQRQSCEEIKRAKAGIQDITEQLINITTACGMCGRGVNVSKLVEDLTQLAISLETSKVRDPYWDNYAAAIFFTTTVITTIGYGNIFPATGSGRILFIFYALVGIPLALILLTTVGKVLSKRLFAPFEKRIVRKYSMNSKQSVRFKVGLLSATFIIGMGIFIFVPALIFHSMETWTYGEAVYYSFATLTTVGFGDFVPKQAVENGYKSVLYIVLSAAWIWLGLAFVAMVVTELQRLFELTGKDISEFLCYVSVREKPHSRMVNL